MPSKFARSDSSPAETVVARLLEQEKVRPNSPAYFVKRGNRWRPTSWKEYAEQARRVARALIALGLQPGETTCILGANRPEWTIFDLGSSMAGGVPVGIYATSSGPEIRYVVDHCEARFLLVESADHLAKALSEREHMPRLQGIMMMESPGSGDLPDSGDLPVSTWEDLLEAGREISREAVEERIRGVTADSLGTLIYTSGTTGPPKGVMLSHGNIAWTAQKAVVELISAQAQDCLLSYLPLSHIAERTFTVYGSVSAGYPVYFAESGEKVAENLREVQPTMIFGVPRVWERLYGAVHAKMSTATGLKRLLLARAREVGRRVSALRCRGAEASGLLALRHRLASRLIFDKVKPLMGLGRARVCVSGAAPISREILEFFASLDIVIQEVYGQSEDCGPTSFNRLDRTRLGTVGPAIPGVEVEIAEDGEVLVRGPNVFQGYFKDPEATAEALVDGWLHSGDLGQLDEDGFLIITGRKKEIIITSGGKNISPSNIEGALKELDLVADAVVIGEGQRYLTALLTLAPDALEALAERSDELIDSLHESERVRAELQAGVDQINSALARVQQVRGFRVLPRPFSIETGELTPTLKVKRKVVAEKYAAEIASLYAP